LNDRAIPIGKLVLWPAVVTLAITLLRLVGELLDWAPALFNRSAGGGGSPLGVSWLPPVFGVLFAVQLVRAGFGPARAGKAIGMAVLGVVVAIGLMMVAGSLGILQPGTFSLFGLLAFTLALTAGAAVAWIGWPALGQVLLAYALAARIPVALVMLVAMLGDWQTHYDVAPPGFPAMGVMAKWLQIGLLPQLTVWLAITVLFGVLFGSLAGALGGRRTRS
jgi:hypothetical protein